MAGGMNGETHNTRGGMRCYPPYAMTTMMTTPILGMVVMGSGELSLEANLPESIPSHALT